MSEKKRFSKRGYLSYFAKNAAGEYVYNGKYFSLADKAYSAFSLKLFLFAFPSMAAVVAAGIAPVPGMKNCFYVIIPYLFEAGFCVSVIWAAVRFAANKKPLREYVYDSTVKALPLRALSAAVSSACAAVGQTVFIILNGIDGAVAWAVLGYALKAAVIVLALLLRKSVKGSKWIETDSVNE